jgi:hypothetical protein
MLQQSLSVTDSLSEFRVFLLISTSLKAGRIVQVKRRNWRKINKPYLKLMNLIKNSKGFEIPATIKHRVDLGNERF